MSPFVLQSASHWASLLALGSVCVSLMPPVNLLNCSLVSYSVCKRECSVVGLGFRVRTKRSHHQRSGQQQKYVKRTEKKMRSSAGGTRFLRILACLCSFRSAEQVQLQHYDLAALI